MTPLYWTARICLQDQGLFTLRNSNSTNTDITQVWQGKELQSGKYLPEII